MSHLKLVKPNPRPAKLLEIYRLRITAEIRYCDKQISDYTKERKRLVTELADPQEHDYYCRECGRGNFSSYSADQCCNDKHP